MARCFLPLVLLFSSRVLAAVDPIASDVEFVSHGVTLAGSLALPAKSPIAALVFVHGSGPQTRDMELAQRFAAAGIAALVYDKRGAGRSGGVYEGQQSVSGPNISLLADDALAALQALRARLPAGTPVGLAGISQAGWIAPLAAERDGRLDFLVLWSGPVCKVSEEDIYSIYTHDRDAANPPSFQQALDSRSQPYQWPPELLGVDTDPATSLRKLHIPGLWIFGGRDGSIPVDLSMARLQALRAAGARYEHLMFEGQGHNNMGTTFNAATDWIRRQFHRH